VAAAAAWSTIRSCLSVIQEDQQSSSRIEQAVAADAAAAGVMPAAGAAPTRCQPAVSPATPFPGTGIRAFSMLYRHASSCS
jgi:hypothetical protein